jgi:hypothetical protein
MTREYPKKHNNDHHRTADHPSDHPLAGQTGPQRDRTVPISIIHDEEVEKAKAEIAALVQRAREVQLEREDPLAEKPEIEFINELQDLFKQVHKLNARWLADPGYEYVPPPAPLPQPGLEPAPPAPVDEPAPI